MDKKYLKKIISLLIIFTIIISFIPNISFSATIPSSWYNECIKVFPQASRYTPTEFNQRINEIAVEKNVSVSIDVPEVGVVYINPFIRDSARYYNQLVYGLPPQSDLFATKSDGSMYKYGTSTLGEYKHVGYNKDSELVTNDKYSLGGTVNPNRKFRDYGVNGIDKVSYTPVSEAKYSWDSLNPTQKDYLKTASFYDDDFHLGDSSPTGFTLNQIHGNKVENMIYVQTPVGVWTGGSVRDNNSLTGWNTLMFKPMFTFEPTIRVYTNGSNYTLKNGQNEINIEVFIEVGLDNSVGKFPLTYFDKIVFKHNGSTHENSNINSVKSTHSFIHTIYRKDLKEGITNSVSLSGSAEVHSFIPDDTVKRVTGNTSINVTVEANLEPYAEASLTLEYDKLYNNQDVSIGRRLNYELKNKPYGTYVTKVEIQYTRETKINVTPAAEKGQNYTKVTIPKSEFATAVFCKYFFPKVAKYFSIVLQQEFPQCCKPYFAKLLVHCRQ